MRILLLGEYSNVHATLAKGLKKLGHEVLVVSNGDFWKDYDRDISLVRKPGLWGTFCYVAKLLAVLPRLRNFDVVQLINPMFLELKAQRISMVYRYLRKHNEKVFMGAFGMDYYWIHVCDTQKPLRYSDFNIGDELRHNEDADRERNDWVGTPKERLNKMIAHDCDGIIAGLYEYWACYHLVFPHKTTFIPFPVEMPSGKESSDKRLQTSEEPRKTVFFIGINKERSAYKGTDIMLKAAEKVLERHPDRMTLKIAESVPFSQYRQLIDDSDAILDQLYSYTPSMNSLLAMSKGIIDIGGGEPENYDILNETELKPIINVEPTYESVVGQMERLVLNPQRIPLLKRQSVEYVKKHHDYMKVARQYVEVFCK